GLARIGRRSQPVDDSSWRPLLERSAREAGVGGAVRLRQSHEVGAPIVYGWRRSTILLPADAGAWDAERRRVVLLHELAHIVRRDPLTQSIAWLACAGYWFHPFVWKAAARLRAESERACDDRVLSSGVAPANYASHLLSLARRARALRLAGAVSVAMARRSTLEGRLLSLLDEGVRRGFLTARVRGAGIAALALILLGVGLVRPVAPAAAVAEAGASGSKPSAVPAASDASTADRSAPEKEAAAAAEEPEPGAEAFNAQQPAKPGEKLELDLESGAPPTGPGWDEARVEVRGFLAGRDAHWQSAGLEREGSRIVLRIAPKRRSGSFSTSNRFTIRVPRRFDIQLASAGGKVTILDVEGRFD